MEILTCKSNKKSNITFSVYLSTLEKDTSKGTPLIPPTNKFFKIVKSCLHSKIVDYLTEITYPRPLQIHRYLIEIGAMTLQWNVVDKILISDVPFLMLS